VAGPFTDGAVLRGASPAKLGAAQATVNHAMAMHGARIF